MEPVGHPTQLLLENLDRMLDGLLHVLQRDCRLRRDACDDLDLLGREGVALARLIHGNGPPYDALVHQRNEENQACVLGCGDVSVRRGRIRSLVVQQGRPSKRDGISSGLAQLAEGDGSGMRCSESSGGDLGNEHPLPQVDQVDEYPADPRGIKKEVGEPLQ